MNFLKGCFSSVLGCGCLIPTTVVVVVFSCLALVIGIPWFLNAPTAPVVAAAPAVAAPAAAAPASGAPATGSGSSVVADASCKVVHDYPIVRDMQEVSAASGYILHVEFYESDGVPEKEAILNGGVRYAISGLRGHAWEYAGSGCTKDFVSKQVNAHIARRLAEKANNSGWATPAEVALFRPQ